MSQFDYPRINFSGDLFMDVATGNNGWYLPLVIFDPIGVVALSPPRLYLKPSCFATGKTIDDIKAKIPTGCPIKVDATGMYQQIPYIEILPVNTDDIWEEWANTPLGQNEVDKDYWGLYSCLNAPSNRTLLLGCIPAYWNYYGTMGIGYKDVTVKSIAMRPVPAGEEILTAESTDLPPETRGILDSRLNMNYHPLDDSTSSAVMVDLLPTMAMYSQIFCDRLNLVTGDAPIMSGKPTKASLRLVNSFRVANENMPFGGSGVFYSVIPVENLDGGEQSPIMQFFKRHALRPERIKGVFINQMICEIEENRELNTNLNYQKAGLVRNPAWGTLAGTISPWYEGDMASWTIARQLLGDKPYYTSRPKDSYYAPVLMGVPTLFQLDADHEHLVLDFLNSIPLRNKQGQPNEPPATPDTFNNHEYETYNLGELEVTIDKVNYETGGIDSVSIGKFMVDQDHLPREKVFADGGIVRIPLNIDPIISEKLLEWNLGIYGKDEHGNRVRVWAETDFVIASDQCGLYANQGDDPIRGYISNTGAPEPCILRIFRHGKPVERPMYITILESRMDNSGAQMAERLYRIAEYKDGDPITFSTDIPMNALYLFRPGVKPAFNAPLYPAQVCETGFFINLKVLPLKDYTKYINPHHPEYTGPPTFQTLYDEIFRRYRLLYPLMRFQPIASFETLKMAAYLIAKTDPLNWLSGGYMPVTRDLSSSERMLIQAWAAHFMSLDAMDLIEFEHHTETFLRSIHSDLVFGR